MRKILINSIVFALFILLFVRQTTFATESGAVTFKAIDSNGCEVGNLEVKIYKVASYENSKLIAIEEFKKFDVENLSDTDITNMQEYASKEVSAFITRTTDDNGIFTVSNLETRRIFISSK